MKKKTESEAIEDRELDALKACVEHLNGLLHDEQNRVLVYLNARYGWTPPQTD